MLAVSLFSFLFLSSVAEFDYPFRGDIRLFVDTVEKRR